MRAAPAAALAALSVLALAPSAGAATYEGAGVFAGSATPLTEEQLEADEEIQLGGVSAMAVNRTGAGGVPRGTLYAVSRRGGDFPRVAVYDPQGQGLAFSLAWEAKSIAGPYQRCGPALGVKEGKAEHPCKAWLADSAGELGIDVDQATGDVYVFDGGEGRVSVFDAEGAAAIARFGEKAAGGKKVAETPSLFHGSSGTGGIAVNDAGEAYVFDLNSSDNFYHRLMVFRPKTPGDYSEYEYAGEIAAGFQGENTYPTRPVLDEAGHLYIAGEGPIQRLAPQSPEPYPAAHPAPACGFTFLKEGIKAMTVNPASGEPFFFSEKKEKGFTHKVVHQLSPCEAGKFKEIAKFEVLPERDDLYALAFDPLRKLEAARPAGVLYGGAPGPAPAVGTGEPGQSALGYLFAQAKGAAKALSVAKTGTGTGTVTSTPAGISCGATCATEFPEGEAVALSAKADPGSIFAGWSGDCAGAGTCEVTMSEARSVTAQFDGGGGPVFHTLKVSVSGEGEVSADSGTISGCTPAGGPSCEGSYEEGAKVTLTETPKAGSLFKGWGTPQCDESTAATCQVTIGKGDEAVAASFEAEPEEPGVPLTVSVEGPGTVTSDKGLISCPPFCSDEYKEGTKVTLTASPSGPSSLFMAWRHCDSGGVNGRRCTVSMSKAKAVSAVFAGAHVLTLAKAEGSGPGKLQSYGGSVCLYACTSALATIKEGTAVTVKQTPAKHFHFAGWGGDCSGTGACELAMGEDHEVSALFEADPKLSLSLTKAGGGQALIKSTPAGISCGFTCPAAGAAFYEGEAITISWKLNKGTTKLTWSEGAGTCTGSSEAPEGSCTLGLSAATELAAALE